MTPLLESVHISTGEKPNTEPTERSNSPEVISSVIASAIRPSSTVKASVLLIFPGDRKSWLIAQNTNSSTTSSTNGPNSGRAISRCGSERRSKFLSVLKEDAAADRPPRPENYLAERILS